MMVILAVMMMAAGVLFPSPSSLPVVNRPAFESPTLFASPPVRPVWVVRDAGWTGISRSLRMFPRSDGMMRWDKRTGFDYPEGTRYLWFSVIFDDESIMHVYRADKCFGLWTDANEIGKDGHYHVERQGWWFACEDLQRFVIDQGGDFR